MKKYICIHGHFYQPPRENPWLEVVEEQDSAAPFHDWNQRITAQCYAPNSAARILGPKGVINRIFNNYRLISFNFGPTLLLWLQIQAPEVIQALIEADQTSLKRWGHGNALAQVYNHLIMPLADQRDKLTQIRWGRADFRHRFGHEPEGMWLAETAVDRATLECLAQEGIRFTILAPRQAAEVRPSSDKPWQKVDAGSLDTRRPYRVNLGNGREMAVFFYQPQVSQAIAYEGILRDGGELARRLKGALDPQPGEPQLVSIATDGESYGHHHPFGEMALAYALSVLEADPEVELTNYAAFLAAHPPTWEARIVENSSWSCAHGVERWRSDCGCAVDPGRGWSQAWRAPLREGLENLRLRLARLTDHLGGDLFKDPWAARDDYVQVLLKGDQDTWREFLARHGRGQLGPREQVQAAKLMECQRWSLYSFTSCAWFFDDLAGIEAVQNLRFAARALQLADDLDGEGWEEGLLADLAKASSNLALEGSGVDIWRRMVQPARVGPRRVAAHAVIEGVTGDEPLPPRVYCWRLEPRGLNHRHNLGMHLAWGRMDVSHRRVGEAHELAFAAMYAGGHEFLAWVSPAEQAQDLDQLGERLEQPLRLLEKFRLQEILEQTLPGRRFTLGDLFLEGRRGMARGMLELALSRYKETARSLYEANRDLMLFLRQINVPLPRLFTSLAEAMLGEELVDALEEGQGGVFHERLGQLAAQSRALGLSLADVRVRRALEGALMEDLRALEEDPHESGVAAHADQVLDLAHALGTELDFWRAQNLAYALRRRLGAQGLPPALSELIKRLNLSLEEA